MCACVCVCVCMSFCGSFVRHLRLVCLRLPVARAHAACVFLAALLSLRERGPQQPNGGGYVSPWAGARRGEGEHDCLVCLPRLGYGAFWRFHNSALSVFSCAASERGLEGGRRPPRFPRTCILRECEREARERGVSDVREREARAEAVGWWQAAGRRCCCVADWPACPAVLPERVLLRWAGVRYVPRDGGWRDHRVRFRGEEM